MKHTILTLGFLLFSLLVFSQSSVKLEGNSKQKQAEKKIAVLPPVELIPINPNASAKDLEQLKSPKRAVLSKENPPSKGSQPKKAETETPQNDHSKKK
jgi:hypothetical protein